MPSLPEGPALPTSLALLTRDLRVTDNPVLDAACEVDRTVVLFVLDPTVLATASPNRRWALGTALADLRGRLRGLGGDLVVREGAAAEVVADLVREHGISEVHVARDSSRTARRRQRRLATHLPDDVLLEVHDSHGLVAPGAVAPQGGDHYRVFTPYFRSWDGAPRRHVASTPTSFTRPDGIDPGHLPTPQELADGSTSPALRPVSETDALARAEAFLDGPVDDYEAMHDDVGRDATSRLAADLHFGTVSATWLEDHLDLRREGHRAFRRQLCWRDFHLQVLDRSPDLGHRDWRPRGDRWRNAPDEVEAWKQGRTGYPLVDAGMRQLAHEGFMHNRVRMVVASFLVKTLYVDWRVGLAHFADLLVDADLANNAANWQWIAGTGADSRPNRVLNPVRQAERFDRDATYIRRWIPELRDVEEDRDAREPWRLAGTAAAPDYPDPIVDLDEGRARFQAARELG